MQTMEASQSLVAVVDESLCIDSEDDEDMIQDLSTSEIEAIKKFVSKMKISSKQRETEIIQNMQQQYITIEWILQMDDIKSIGEKLGFNDEEYKSLNAVIASTKQRNDKNQEQADTELDNNGYNGNHNGKSCTSSSRYNPLGNDGNKNKDEFNGYGWTYDHNKDELKHQQVAKREIDLNLIQLTYIDNDKTDKNGINGNLKTVPNVKGAKALEYEDFSSGMLEIAPSSCKIKELSYFTEVFFVYRCENDKLLFKLNDDEYRLSEGSHFCVPAENEYSIQNLSKTQVAKLNFTLIKSQYDSIFEGL